MVLKFQPLQGVALDFETLYALHILGRLTGGVRIAVMFVQRHCVRRLVTWHARGARGAVAPDHVRAVLIAGALAMPQDAREFPPVVLGENHVQYRIDGAVAEANEGAEEHPDDRDFLRELGAVQSYHLARLERQPEEREHNHDRDQHDRGAPAAVARGLLGFQGQQVPLAGQFPAPEAHPRQQINDGDQQQRDGVRQDAHGHAVRRLRLVAP